MRVGKKDPEARCRLLGRDRGKTPAGKRALNCFSTRIFQKAPVFWESCRETQLYDYRRFGERL